jgi:hypothetical protein
MSLIVESWKTHKKLILISTFRSIWLFNICKTSCQLLEKHSYVPVCNPHLYRLLNRYRFSGTTERDTIVPSGIKPWYKCLMPTTIVSSPLFFSFLSSSHLISSHLISFQQHKSQIYTTQDNSQLKISNHHKVHNFTRFTTLRFGSQQVPRVT